MNGIKKIQKKPPSTDIKSFQFDLFSQFVTNDKSDVSNTVKLWERIPKYFPVRTIEKHFPEGGGWPNPYEWSYTESGSHYKVVIQPALIKVNGKYKAFFPSTTEELIEEVLKKTLTEQQCGIHSENEAETWVRFTQSMIHRELKARGSSRSRSEVKKSIKIMSRSIVTLYQEEKEVWSGSILQDLITVGRSEYLMILIQCTQLECHFLYLKLLIN